MIGIGNEFRRDDGAGPAVVARLREMMPPGVALVVTDGEPTRLVEAWTGAALAVVVDAVRAEPPEPGRVHRFVLDRPGTGAVSAASSHGLGLDDAIALALALDRMPGRLVVHAVEAADLSQGPGLTPAVAAAVPAVAAAVLADIGPRGSPPPGWLPRPGRRPVTADDLLPVGAGDRAGPVRMDDQFPAHLVQHHVVVPPADPGHRTVLRVPGAA